MLTNETLFSLASLLAMTGWVVLLATPFNFKWTQLYSAYLVPLTLSVLYAALIAVHWASADGGFDSLANVATLFETPGLLLAGWVHYLAFDLFVGAWIAARSQEENIPFLIVVPCLFMTFMFGPLGFLIWMGIRLSRTARPTRSA